MVTRAELESRAPMALLAVLLLMSLASCSSCGEPGAQPRDDPPGPARGSHPFHTSWDGGRRERQPRQDPRGRLGPQHGARDGGGEAGLPDVAAPPQ